MNNIETFFGQENGCGPEEKNNSQNDEKERSEKEEFFKELEYHKRALIGSMTPKEEVDYQKIRKAIFLEKNDCEDKNKLFLLSKIFEMEEVAAELTKIIEKLIREDFNSYEDWKNYSLIDSKFRSIKKEIDFFYYKMNL